MEKPLTEFAYDTDPKQSAQTRVRLLNMLAANNTPSSPITSPGRASGMWPSRATGSGTTRSR